MNFDKSKFAQLTAELATVQARETEIIDALRTLLAPQEPPTQGQTKMRKSPKKPKTKGQLQDVVFKVMESYSSPVTLAQVSKKLAKVRPGTRPAAVASVLAAAAKKGKIQKPSPDSFYLPRTEPTPVVTKDPLGPMPKAAEEVLES